jgi:hypothetical protein
MDNNKLKEALLKEKAAILKQLNENNINDYLKIEEITAPFVVVLLNGDQAAACSTEYAKKEGYTKIIQTADTESKARQIAKEFNTENNSVIYENLKKEKAVILKQLNEMIGPKKIPEDKIGFENGEVYINGELYGTEEEFYNDKDLGLIEIIPVHSNKPQYKDEEEHIDNIDEMMGASFSAERRQNRRQNYIGQHHNPQAPQSQATLQENIELRKMIRESFDKVFEYHKMTANLEETSDVWAKKLTPQQKERMDRLFEDAINETGQWKNVHWQIAKSGRAKLSNEEMNYVFDRMVESYLATHDNKYKRAMGNFYNPVLAPDIVTYLYHRLNASTPLENVARNSKEFNDLIFSRVWGRMFAGGKIDANYMTNRAGGKKMVDSFDNMMAGISPTSKTFGSFFMATFYRFCQDLINEMIAKKADTISIDAPSQTTGKGMDIGDEERDYGDLDVDTKDDTLGGNLSDDPEDIAKREREKMYRGNADLTIQKLQKAFEEIVDTAMSENISNAKVIAFEETVLEYKTPEEIAAKYKDIFPDKQKVSVALTQLKTDQKFNQIADAVLKKYGFPNVVKTMEWSKIQRLGKELQANTGKEKVYHEPEHDERYVYEDKLVAEAIERVKARLIMASLKKS